MGVPVLTGLLALGAGACGLAALGVVLSAAAIVVGAAQAGETLLGDPAIDAIWANGITFTQLHRREFMPWWRIVSVDTARVAIRIDDGALHGEVFHHTIRFSGDQRTLRITPREGGLRTAHLLATQAGLTWNGVSARRAAPSRGVTAELRA